MEISRLKNSEIVETKHTKQDYIRPAEAEKGNGWYKVIDNKPVLEPYEKIEGTNYVYLNDEVTKEYNVVQLPLDDYKQVKKNQIKQTYQELLRNGFVSSSGIKVDCESSNVSDFSNGYELLKTTNSTEINIRDYDNKVHTLTFSEYESLVIGLGNYFQQQLNLKWTKQDEIDALTTHEEVKNYKWVI